jgi:hypothetical protein
MLPGEAVTTFSSFRFSELSQSICSSPLLRLPEKSVSQMPSTAILHEVKKLYSVNERLDSLAEDHTVVSETRYLGQHSQHSHFAGIAGGDKNIAIFGNFLILRRCRIWMRLRFARAEASREERYLEANYEPATHSRVHIG